MALIAPVQVFVPVVMPGAGVTGFRCEVTDEPVGQAECLLCAQRGATGCAMIPAYIEQISKDQRPHDFSQQLSRKHGADFGISVTEVLYCPRKLRLKMQHGWTEKPSDFYARWAGTATHAGLEAYSGPGVAEERMIVVFDFRGQKVLLSGKPDLVEYAPSLGWTITDYKRTGWPPRQSYSYACPACNEIILEGVTDRRGLKFYCPTCDADLRRRQVHQITHAPQARDSHAMQINLLALLLLRNEEQYTSLLEAQHGVVTAGNTDRFSGQVVYLGTQGIVRCPVAVDLEAARDLLRQRLDVLLSPDLPARLPEAQWECKYCPVAEHCEAAA